MSLYLDLVEKFTDQNGSWRSANRSSMCSISSIAFSRPSRSAKQFQKYARSILRPSFEEVGWEPKSSESAKTRIASRESDQGARRSDDKEIVAGCRDRFQKYLTDPKSLAPDLRPSVLAVVAVTPTKRPGPSSTSSA